MKKLISVLLPLLLCSSRVAPAEEVPGPLSPPAIAEGAEVWPEARGGETTAAESVLAWCAGDLRSPTRGAAWRAIHPEPL